MDFDLFSFICFHVFFFVLAHVFYAFSCFFAFCHPSTSAYMIYCNYHDMGQV